MQVLGRLENKLDLYRMPSGDLRKGLSFCVVKLAFQKVKLTRAKLPSVEPYNTMVSTESRDSFTFSVMFHSAQILIITL